MLFVLRVEWVVICRTDPSSGTKVDSVR